MRLTTSIAFVVTSFSLLVASKPTIASLESRCTIETNFAPSYIGEFKNVLVQTASCPSDVLPPVERNLEGRQASVNVCGANCTTNCFAGATNAPTTSDCHVIADALLYESQNGGALFNVANGTNNQIIMSFQACKTFFLNQDLNTLTYCRSAWSQLVDWLSTSCAGTKGAHGGNCVAVDQRWFVQVQHP
jgi:hypothetical protein